MLTLAGLRRPHAATRSVLVVVVAVAAVSMSLTWARGARADSGSGLVSLTNGARAAAGLPGLRVSTDLAAAAQRQAAHMAATQVLAHTVNLPGAVCCWQALGENVGEGASAAVIHAAFMASPEHRANILGTSYTQVGIGVVVDAHGTMWVSEIFRRPLTPVPAQPPQPQPQPRPVVTHPPTQAPVPAPAHRVQPSRSIAHVTAATTPAAKVTSTAPAANGLSADGRASRALVGGRLPLVAAQRLAARIWQSSRTAGPDPVSSLIDFVDSAIQSAP